MEELKSSNLCPGPSSIKGKEEVRYCDGWFCSFFVEPDICRPAVDKEVIFSYPRINAISQSNVRLRLNVAK